MKMKPRIPESMSAIPYDPEKRDPIAIVSIHRRATSVKQTSAANKGG
jgi:hypothetical protein